jgi:hypothetical protein
MTNYKDEVLHIVASLRQELGQEVLDRIGYTLVEENDGVFLRIEGFGPELVFVKIYNMFVDAYGWKFVSYTNSPTGKMITLQDKQVAERVFALTLKNTFKNSVVPMPKSNKRTSNKR